MIALNVEVDIICSFSYSSDLSIPFKYCWLSHSLICLQVHCNFVPTIAPFVRFSVYMHRLPQITQISRSLARQDSATRNCRSASDGTSVNKEIPFSNTSKGSFSESTWSSLWVSPSKIDWFASCLSFINGTCQAE